MIKWGELMHTCGSKIVNSPFRFSIRTFSKSFSPNGSELSKSLDIPKWTGRGQKGGLTPPMASKMLHSLFRFQYAHSLKISAQMDQNCQSPLISQNWIGCYQKEVNTPYGSQNVTFPFSLFHMHLL